VRWWCALPEPSEQDALRAVREHLDEAHAAADRLVREAQRQAEEAGGDAREEVPPRGWDAGRAQTARGPDVQALLALLDAVRDAVPAELSQQLAEALRQLLLALRALLDWYIERLGEPAPGRGGVEVEDIPLD
jgi:cell division septum initiation protein DivIVA